MRRHAIGLVFFLAGTTTIGLSAADAEGQAQPKSTGAATPSSAKDGGTAAVTSTAAKDGGTGSVSAGTDGGPPSAAAAGSGPAVPIPDKPAVDGATYGVRLRDLEARVDELKDQIRRSHTRLALLSDTILSGGAAGSRAEVVFKNEMSSAFRLIQALFVVDGAVQYNRSDETGALADQKEIPIFNGSIPPGDHTVQVKLKFQGNGYGVFTYLRGYKFETQSAHSFTSVEGKSLQVVATALEKGGVTTPLEQRPSIEWGEKINALSGSAPAAAAPGAPPVKTQGQTGNGSASGSISVGGK